MILLLQLQQKLSIRFQDTAFSHGRTFVVEVMGRNAGDIALWAGIASGADQIIVPEEEYEQSTKCYRKVKRRLTNQVLKLTT